MHARLTSGLCAWLLAGGAASAGPTGYTISDARFGTTVPNFGAPNHLISVDLATGQTTDLGALGNFPTGVHWVEGMTRGPNGKLYAVKASSTDGIRLWDVTNPPGVLLGAPSMFSNIPRGHPGLSYNPVDNFLYIIQGSGGDASVPKGRTWLVRMSPVNGSAVMLTPLGSPTADNWFADALAINAVGEAFAADFASEGNLYRVNLTNGVHTLVGSLGLPELHQLAGMDFDESGQLWAIAGLGGIYKVNTTSGQATQVATIDIPGKFWTALAVAGGGCYPDCNGDGALNLADFGCFQTKFALADPYADCNGDGVRNLADFGCFQTEFGLGCP